MPNIKSAKKRQQISQRDKMRNKSCRSELATALKKAKSVIKSGDVKAAQEILPQTFSILDEMVTKGIIHKNKADRNKAKLSAQVAKLAK